MPNWPVTLPVYPLLEGYRETPPNQIIRSQMDQGPAKLRRRTTAAVRLFQVGFMLSQSQIDDLENFYLTTLVGGALSFDFTHPRTGATVTCRFASPPEYSAANGDYLKAFASWRIMVGGRVALRTMPHFLARWNARRVWAGGLVRAP